MPGMKSTEMLRVKTAPFELKLPEQFDVKPKEEVALPNGYKAFIYDVTVRERHYESAVQKDVHEVSRGWRIVIRSKTGVRADRGRADYDVRDSDATFTKELDVMFFLQAWARTLSKVKVTRTTETDVIEGGDSDD